MINAAKARAVSSRREFVADRNDHSSQIDSESRTAPLIINHGDLVAIARKPQHSLHEVMPNRTTDPTRAQYHVITIARRDRDFTCEF
jgi:hypothetical protein